jgi:hypothetical protein
MRPELRPPEGRAWYKTTVEAYLRQEGDERLRMLGQLAAFTLRNLANKLKPNRSLGHRATNRRGSLAWRQRVIPRPLSGAGRGTPDRAPAYPAWRIAGEAVILSGATRGIQTTPCLDPAHTSAPVSAAAIATTSLAGSPP